MKMEMKRDWEDAELLRGWDFSLPSLLLLFSSFLIRQIELRTRRLYIPLLSKTTNGERKRTSLNLISPFYPSSTFRFYTSSSPPPPSISRPMTYRHTSI
jgi:hypothetical protein